MLQVQSVLSKLVAQRDRLQLAAADHRALFSPPKRLPPELLSEIFVAPALLDVHLTPTYPTVLTYTMGPFFPLRFAGLGGERPSQTPISGPPFDSDLDATSNSLSCGWNDLGTAI
jgi:hypothetical protein